MADVHLPGNMGPEKIDIINRTREITNNEQLQ